jgi:hypothetical protein
MASKENYSGSMNSIVKCILVTSLVGATPVPSLLFAVCLSMLISAASIACVVVVPFYQ